MDRLFLKSILCAWIALSLSTAPARPAEPLPRCAFQTDTLCPPDTAARRLVRQLAGTQGFPYMDEILPASPKASAFLKYGEYPVSLYTGLVDITIPLYTISTGWIDVPIELKYHASGLKYDDVDMEAGLGWDLIAGGVVTHVVRGAEDTESAQDYFRDVSDIKVIYDPEYGTGPEGEDYGEIRQTANGARPQSSRNHALAILDGEYDLWRFSFLGYAGTYFFPGSQGTSSVVFIPDSGMKAASPGAPVITDTDGVVYSFTATEGGTLSTRQYQEWYMTEITPADRSDEITFTYDMISPAAGYEIRRPFINAAFTRITENSYGWTDPEDTYTGMAGYDSTYPPRLARIDFKGGYLKFVYSSQSGNDSWNLQCIEVYSQASVEPIRTVTLHKGRFSNGEDRLDKVEFTDREGDSYCYSFEYNGEPADFSMNGPDNGIDHWGYFNGTTAENSRYMPVSDALGNDGIDREADETWMMKGVLDRIVYPTKGYTEFTYEAHKWHEGGSDLVFGGLRIKEIRNYKEDGVLAERKRYTYGSSEDGKGSILMYPTISDYTYTGKQFISEYDTYLGSGWTNHYIGYSTVASMPKRSYFQSGSSVVYPYVTEYVSNGTEDYGKTVYRYLHFPDELLPPVGDTYRWYSDDRLLRDNAWKSGQLLGKTVYRKEEDGYVEVYSLDNSYKEINMAEYKNLRVKQYASFVRTPSSMASAMPDYDAVYTQYPDFKDAFDAPSNRNPSPYDYYNYYTSTGLSVLESSVETLDGVSAVTDYEYNRYGFPVRSVTRYATGDSTVTVTRYVTDSASVYSGMVSRNMVSSWLSRQVSRNGTVVSDESMSYSNLLSDNDDLFAPSALVQSYGSDIVADAWRTVYHRYDEHGHPLYLTRADGVDVVCLWSYDGRYPVLQVENATWSQVCDALGEDTVAGLSGMMPGDDVLEGYASALRSALPGAMVTLCTYSPLVGVTSMTGPSGRKISCGYDGFGRLVSVKDEDGNLVEAYEYNYSNWPL